MISGKFSLRGKNFLSPQDEFVFIIRRYEQNRIVFAGQGAQAVGWDKDLAEKFPSARACSTAPTPRWADDLARDLFQRPEVELIKTETRSGNFLVSWFALNYSRSALEFNRYMISAVDNTPKKKGTVLETSR